MPQVRMIDENAFGLLIAYFDIDLVVRTVGASGTIVACGIVGLGVEGTATAKQTGPGEIRVGGCLLQSIDFSRRWREAR